MKDYKAIWNNLSTNFADASFFVCCIGDEDEIRTNGQQTAGFLKSVLSISDTDKVLEIGCGVARIGRELAPDCGEWHGVDISGNMIRYARERTADVPNAFLHELPENNLRIFPSNSFDCVYCTIVFMHLDKPDVFTYIREAYRVLKPGGRAYFDTYNIMAPQAWQEFLKVVTLFPSGQRPGHVSQFSTPQEINKFLEEAGFSAIHIDAQNEQLVVALGQKVEPSVDDADFELLPEGADFGTPVESASGQLAVTDYAMPHSTAANLRAEISELNADRREAQAYARILEGEFARKNAAIRELENRLRWREAQLVRARKPRLPWKR